MNVLGVCHGRWCSIDSGRWPRHVVHESTGDHPPEGGDGHKPGEGSTCVEHQCMPGKVAIQLTGTNTPLLLLLYSLTKEWSHNVNARVMVKGYSWWKYSPVGSLSDMCMTIVIGYCVGTGEIKWNSLHGLKCSEWDWDKALRVLTTGVLHHSFLEGRFHANIIVLFSHT